MLATLAPRDSASDGVVARRRTSSTLPLARKLKCQYGCGSTPHARIARGVPFLAQRSRPYYRGECSSVGMPSLAMAR